MGAWKLGTRTWMRQGVNHKRYNLRDPNLHLLRIQVEQHHACRNGPPSHLYVTICQAQACYKTLIKAVMYTKMLGNMIWSPISLAMNFSFHTTFQYFPCKWCISLLRCADQELSFVYCLDQWRLYDQMEQLSWDRKHRAIWLGFITEAEDMAYSAWECPLQLWRSSALEWTALVVPLAPAWAGCWPPQSDACASVQNCCRPRSIISTQLWLSVLSISSFENQSTNARYT